MYKNVSEKFRKEAVAERVEPTIEPTRPRGIASPNIKVQPQQQQLDNSSPGAFVVDNMKKLIAARERLRDRLLRQNQSSTSPVESFMSGIEKGAKSKQEASVEVQEDSSEEISYTPEQRSFARPRGERTMNTSNSDHPFISMIDRTEGGGDYDALLGFSNRNHFSGVRVTDMTLAEIDNFARTTYGAWSRDWKRRNRHGDASVASTPMGRYQFVNTTLQSVARQMGLSPETKFTPEVQDRVFDFYLRSRLSRANTLPEKRAQLRNAWEGFKHVSNAELDEAINKLS